MAIDTIEEIKTPTKPGDWIYLGQYNGVQHYWVYKEEGVVTYDMRIEKSATGYPAELREKISGEYSYGLTFQKIEEALGFADAMMLQIDKRGRITNPKVDI